MKFLLPMPPGINATYGVARTGNQPFYKKVAVRDWEHEAGWEIVRQLATQTPKTYMGDVYFYVEWYYRKNRDIDAGIKVLLDLFQKQGVYPNDMQIIHLEAKKFFDPKNPRVEVWIDSRPIN